jgi:AcrR family transcriptional regulator
MNPENKQIWIDAALSILRHEPYLAISVSRLSREVELDRSSFRHAFKSIGPVEFLIEHVLPYFEHATNAAMLASEPQLLVATPAERLRLILQLLDEHRDLVLVNRQIDQFAECEPAAAKIVDKMWKFRVEMIGRTFEQICGDDRSARVRCDCFVKSEGYGRQHCETSIDDRLAFYLQGTPDAI